MTTLGSASSFAILCNNLTTSGTNTINQGNLGYATITGTVPTLNNGTVYVAPNSNYTNAQADLVVFINYIIANTPTTPRLNLTDLPFIPGFYKISNGIVNGSNSPTTITLDGLGLYYFNIQNFLFFDTDCTILLTGGATADQVFFTQIQKLIFFFIGRN